MISTRSSENSVQGTERVCSCTVKPAFYSTCVQRPPGPYDRNFVHERFCTYDFPCMEQPPGKRDRRPGNFARAGSFTWTLRPFFDICRSDVGCSALSLSISVIVNAGTNHFLQKNCRLFKSQPYQLCSVEKNLHTVNPEYFVRTQFSYPGLSNLSYA